MSYNKFFASSADPEKLALTVKGILTALIPVLLVVLKMSGIEAAETDVAEFITVFTGFLSSGMIFWGVLRKFYYLRQK